MKKFLILTILLIAVVLQSRAQEQKKDPDEQITVNKKYDKNGNLLQYDSTYVHQWSSDSTMNFSFGNGFPNMMDYSAIDSMLQQFGIYHNFAFSPFDDEDFFDQFNEMFPDSFLTDHFAFRNDSSLQYSLNPHSKRQDFFNTPGFDQWQKQMQQQLKQFNEFMPQFQNEEQRKEWEELMRKQQKEQEEFIQKLEKSK